MAKANLSVVQDVLRTYKPFYPLEVEEIEKRLEELPDIDEIEREEIESYKKLAKEFVEIWRAKTSLLHLATKMFVEEKDEEKRRTLSLFIDDLRADIARSLEGAVNAMNRAKVLEEFGLNMHKDYSFLYAVVPLVLLFLLKPKS